MKLRSRKVIVCTLGLLAIVLSARLRPQTEDQPSSDFLRFVDTACLEGRLESAVVSYANLEGIRVFLVAVVHCGDRAYYEKLQEVFENFDVVLFEWIRRKEPETDKTKPPERPERSLVMDLMDLANEAVHIVFTDLFGLEDQGKAVDYTAKNFVWADMDRATWERRARETRELEKELQLAPGILREYAEAKWRQLRNLTLKGLGDGWLAARRDLIHALEYLAARETAEVEELYQRAMARDPDYFTATIHERNAVAMQGVLRQMALGRKKIGVFYGASHMPDLEGRLLRHGFARETQHWFSAWVVER